MRGRTDISSRVGARSRIRIRVGMRITICGRARVSLEARSGPSTALKRWAQALVDAGLFGYRKGHG